MFGNPDKPVGHELSPDSERVVRKHLKQIGHPPNGVLPSRRRRKRRPFVGSSDEDGPAKGKSVGQSPKRRGPLD